MTMQTDGRNIYKKARMAAGITQERAAELLDISTRSLADYEAGVRFPPDWLVSAMLDVYNLQILAVQHLRLSAQLARNIIPDVPDLCLSQAALTFVDAVYDFAEDRLTRELIDIAKDGRVSEEEQERFATVVKRINELTATAMAIVYARRD